MSDTLTKQKVQFSLVDQYFAFCFKVVCQCITHCGQQLLLWVVGKMYDPSDFQKGQVGTRLAGSSITIRIQLFGVSRAIVTIVMTTYTKHGKISVKVNSSWKTKLNDGDHQALKRIVSKQHRTTSANLTAELNINLEDPVFNFTKPACVKKLHLLNL